MTLATVDASGRPSTRIVLIKDFDERGVVWYTNYASRKGQELAGNPFAALQFHWVELERVVRIEGLVESLNDLNRKLVGLEGQILRIAIKAPNKPKTAPDAPTETCGALFK